MSDESNRNFPLEHEVERQYLGVVERQCIDQNFQAAVRHAADINKQAVQASLEIGKEKTQFFEKVVLGSGATIALVVSYVGAHAGNLQPRWLLRSALVCFVLTLLLGLYRNWEFQWYIFASWARQDTKAKQEREKAKKDVILTGEAISSEDGKPIDPAQGLRQFNADEVTLTNLLTKSQKIEDRAFNVVRVVEYVTLGLGVAGMGLLIALAWLNF